MFFHLGATVTAGPTWLQSSWHLIGLLWWDLLLRVLNRTVVIGREHIPPRGAANIMICANHISALDPFLIGAVAMPRFSPVWWRAPAKAELFDQYIIGAILRSWGAFPVYRGQRDFVSIERMIEWLPSSVIVIFPEGTWSKTGQLLRGRPGVGKIIYEARPTVIPVAIEGADRIVPRGHVLPRIGRRVTIAFGPPVDLRRFYAQPDSPELSQEIADAVMAAIGDLYRPLTSE
ncbi:MAG: lysophospholipid acyltransferase family protein [Nitrospirota bacterium]